MFKGYTTNYDYETVVSRCGKFVTMLTHWYDGSGTSTDVAKMDEFLTW